ncbi:MAG: luminescence regulatory protein LuxO [Pseudomonadota bacterium]
MPDPQSNQILLVEDTAPLARVYREYLQGEGYDVHHVETGAAALAAVAARPPAVVVLDLKLPDMDGLAVLRRLSADVPDIPVVVVTAHGSINVAVEAMRDGAFDFLVKPFNAARLTVTVRNARERQALTRMVARYRREYDRDGLLDFVGTSPEMQALYRMLEAVAPSRASVFLTGDSGTGKEMAADAIHRLSPRAHRPFVAINCAAIPKDLLESEIFGHLKGAFTGATADRPGAARLADGGTLFLDEVCEMPLELQAKILRFVQTGTVQPVGGTHPATVDVRLVSATNRNPLAEVKAGRFREDLYYRLHVVPIHLPPLRDRQDDAVLIARRYLREMAGEEGKRFERFTPAVEAVLRAYPWPGNIRELQNVIRNITVLHDGTEVAVDQLPEPVRSTRPAPAGATLPDPGPGTGGGTGELAGDLGVDLNGGGIQPLWQVEKAMIRRALAATANDVHRAADLLEISASTIYRKLQLWRTEGKG